MKADTWYMEHWMMLFDLHIICKTVANGDISLLESSLKLGVVYLFFYLTYSQLKWKLLKHLLHYIN